MKVKHIFYNFNCLFGSVKLTKNADLDKDKYNGYDIEYILVQNFYLQMGAMEKTSLFLVLIWANLRKSIIRENISYFLVKDQHKDYMIPH